MNGKRMMMLKNKLTDFLRKDKKAAVILAAGLLGMIFLLLSCFTDGGDKPVKGSTDIDTFERQTEKRLEELLSEVKNVGKVKVTVTCECLEEYEYARDEKQQGDDRNENEYVIIEENNSDGGLTLRVTAPKVRGVAVCCEGAASDAVKEDVTRLICAALGIGANKVYVSQMKE